DGALDRRFQKIVVEPTAVTQSIEILRHLKPRYEEFHGINYTDEAVEAAVRLTDRYIAINIELSLLKVPVHTVCIVLKSAKRHVGIDGTLVLQHQKAHLYQ
ncbi:MAG: hypothetical protein K5889_00005, partial [Lachnospiraceae bacterium]|nr:hypothetical protein [Lachnospiraceae bacterium]